MSLMNSQGKFAEFNYRFTARSRPPEDDPNWDAFLENFSLKYPQYDSYRNAFFILENGIGDQVCVLGLLQAFKEFFRAKNIIVLAQKKSQELLSLYQHASISVVIYYEKLPKFRTSSAGRVFNVLHRPSKSYSNYGRLGPIFNTFCIPYIDQYRIGMGLPLTSNFLPPRISDSAILRNVNIDDNVNKFIILFPYSNTWDSPPLAFWELLASILKKQGFKVFTNIVNKAASSTSRQVSSMQNKHDPIRGTEPLSCSLVELFYLSEKAHALILNVSGPAWLLAHTSSRNIIIHPDTLFDTNTIRQTNRTSSLSVLDIENLSNNFPELNFHELAMNYNEPAAFNDICKSIQCFL